MNLMRRWHNNFITTMIYRLAEHNFLQMTNLTVCNLNVIVLLEFISKDLYTSLLKVAKFNFLPKHEAEIRP